MDLLSVDVMAPRFPQMLTTSYLRRSAYPTACTCLLR
jgi:hypothetical protein